MKALLFAVILFFSFYRASATLDTLKRAEVFNFSVGDTFEYYHFLYHSVWPPYTDYEKFMFVYETRLDDTINLVFNYSGHLVKKHVWYQQVGFNWYELHTTIEEMSFNQNYDDLMGNCFNGYDYDLFEYPAFCSADSAAFAAPDSNGTQLFHDSLNGHAGVSGVVDDAGWFYSQTKYCNRIGFVISGFGAENGDHADYHLYYYHLADGETWGTPTDFISGLNDLESEFHLQVFPNPACGSTQISLPEKFGRYQAVISDLMGTSIRTYSISDGGANLSLEGIQSGVYMLSVSDGTEWYTTKLIIIQ